MVRPGMICWAAWIAAGALLGVDSLLTGLFSSQSMGKASWTFGAIFMGPVVLHWPAPFDFGAISAAWVAIWIAAIGYVTVLAWFIFPWNRGRELAAGAVWGLVCFIPSVFGFTRLFPWLAAERNWMTLISFGVFGAVAAWALLVQTRKG